MKSQSLDSIKNSGKKRLLGPKVLVRVHQARCGVPVDSVRRAVSKAEVVMRQRVSVKSVSSPPPLHRPKAEVIGWQARTIEVYKQLREHVLDVDFRRLMPAWSFQSAVIAVSMILMFSLGVWYAASTPKSAAVDELLPLAPASPGYIPLAVETQVESDPAISNDTLFNTPIEMLHQYFTSPTSTPADQLADRKAKLHAFLKARNSPFEAQADLIAAQPHWKLILAISFAESTLGKRCYMNNCSGIGGSNIRTYKSIDNWILDFNRLLEHRYKDQTLEQMCGVYVQPCNPNWLLATKQILTGLDADKIE